jgi:cellulose synthase/poly-beta-1,6-N-acetylglucosamine synthase-like glycosyltransferase
MTDLELPYEKDRHGAYRFFEILPGALSWSMLALPFLLSWIDVRLAASFILVYLLINFVRSIAGVSRSLQGYYTVKEHQKLPWRQMLTELAERKINPHAKRPKWHREIIEKRLARKPLFMPPEQVLHAVFVAMYKESREVLEPTIEAILASDYPMKQVILVIAYEERAGASAAELAESLVKKYGSHFYDAMAVCHPRNIPGEVVGKGANITHAAKVLRTYLDQRSVAYERVMVTTLDADNHVDKQYLGALTYAYLVVDNPIRASYQPVSLYTNNIWDAPAPSRVVATGNTIFNLMLTLRGHALRNFSSHAQPMAGLVQTNYWSVRTIVEDGHQFWRSYFAFDGKYRVFPLRVPIYQDAVLSESYIKTLKAQFVQLRRWTYGASDVAYVIQKGFLTKNTLPKLDVFAKTWRLLEGHVTWAVGTILVLFGGFVPNLFTNKQYSAVELPLIVSRIQTVALIALVGMLFLALKTLPPKPAHYKRHRTIFMVLQWVMLPVTSLVYNSLAALNSQTRLMFRRYLSKFDVTEKAVVTVGVDGTRSAKT